MSRWEIGLVSGYSEDLGWRIASAVEGGMRKAWAARTFSVSLSSVKRYVEKITSLSPVYGYAPGGERLRLSVPRELGKNTTLLLSQHAGYHRADPFLSNTLIS